MKTRVINFKDIFSTLRFDGSFHNAEANVYDKVISQHSEHKLSYYCSEIFTSGRNKRVYTSKEYGYPFLSNSDVVSANPFMSCNYSSKKYGYDEKAVLKEGMILTGRVGAIGQTAFVPSYFEKAKAMGSDNIIRICVKPEFKNGFIYAYLASRIGNLSFWKHATGGVQPFITDAMVGELPIPNFPNDFQNEVDNLIQESARFRETANNELKDAVSRLSQFIQAKSCNSKLKTNSVNIQAIRNSLQIRIDPPALMEDGVYAMRDVISRLPYKLLGNLEFVVRRPGIFKRIYVDKGIPYIKGSEIFLTDPFRKCDRLSKTRTPFIDEMELKEGQILVTCAGSCGNIKMITKEYEDKKSIGSQDIIRIDTDMVDDDALINKEYLFTYLQQPFVYSYMQSMKYGSVIERIEPFHIESIPVVVPNKELSVSIKKHIKKYMDDTYKAFNCEEKAIKMVEQEIEKWNN